MVHVRVMTRVTLDPQPNLLPNPPHLKGRPHMGMVRGLINWGWRVVWVHG